LAFTISWAKKRPLDWILNENRALRFNFVITFSKLPVRKNNPHRHGYKGWRRNKTFLLTILVKNMLKWKNYCALWHFLNNLISL
jgi:hypothetical protein